ncbi:MAG: hypothetical protein M9916_11220 [Crocinitomicaceae bacterium]|nr:hypothetical protein [Crocinitomicaceae bacterium]
MIRIILGVTLQRCHSTEFDLIGDNIILQSYRSSGVSVEFVLIVNKVDTPMEF